MRTSNDIYQDGRLMDGYDYERQCWVIGGRYVTCAHPPTMNCGCYGRRHAGEPTVAPCGLTAEQLNERHARVLAHLGYKENAETFAEYHAAIQADVDYQHALIDEYGSKLAGDYRYWPEKHSATPALKAARDAKIAADEAWRRKAREIAADSSCRRCYRIVLYVDEMTAHLCRDCQPRLAVIPELGRE
jgi:hypothetical protein